MARSNTKRENILSTSRFLRDLKDFPPLSVEEEKTLAKQLQSSNKAKAFDARQKMILSNVRLIFSITSRYRFAPDYYPDAISCGLFGLISAVEKFDVEQGFKFSTYATWWIRQAISRQLPDLISEIRIPVHTRDSLNRLYKLAIKENLELSTESSVPILAKKLELTEKNVRDLLAYSKATHQITSIDSSVLYDSEDDSLTLKDTLVDRTEGTAEDHLLAAEDALTLQEIINELPERMQEIIRRRFGFYGESETLAEVGAHYGVTRERVRQIESSAKQLISQKLKKRQLTLKNFYPEPTSESSLNLEVPG